MGIRAGLADLFWNVLLVIRICRQKLQLTLERFQWFQDLFYRIAGYPEKLLQGELALITGGGGGLGRLMAQRLAKLGVDVIIWDINQAGELDEFWARAIIIRPRNT